MSERTPGIARDRRTIITLVLMPLLVYPLLSMILQRLLVSTTAADQEPSVVKIGLSDASLHGPLSEAIARGKHLLADRGRETSCRFYAAMHHLRY